MPRAASFRGMPHQQTTLAALVAAFPVFGCATFSIPADRCPSFPETPVAVPAATEVKVQYLGVGGYLVSHGPDTVLFGPVYSNPGILEVFFDHEIRTDQGLVDRLLPKEADEATAIVVGHSHYDHLLDTPYIASKKATNATVYGSATTAALLHSFPGVPVVDVSAAAQHNTSIRIGRRMRLWPIPSRHSDQFRLKNKILGLDLPIHGWRGEVLEPQASLPRTASGWPEGKVFSFVLDFLDDRDGVAFRLYYQDSGTDDPIGIPGPGRGPQDGRPFDLTLACVGGDFEKLHGHPEALIAATKPRFLVLGHWEDFFVTQGEICRTGRISAVPPPAGILRRSATAKFVARSARALKKAGVTGRPILPCPTASVLLFPLNSNQDQKIYSELERRRTKYDCRVPIS